MKVTGSSLTSNARSASPETPRTSGAGSRPPVNCLTAFQSGSRLTASSWVPVSAVSPDLLVKQIEVQRKETGDERAPLLPPPGGEESP